MAEAIIQRHFGDDTPNLLHVVLKQPESRYCSDDRTTTLTENKRRNLQNLTRTDAQQDVFGRQAFACRDQFLQHSLLAHGVLPGGGERVGDGAPRAL